MNTKALILMAAGIIMQLIFIICEKKGKYVAADILKGSASAMFVLIGYLGYKASMSGFSKLIFIGLCFGMLGDILLNLRFVFESAGQKIFLAGIAAFLIGHILYLAAIYPLSASPLVPVITGIILSAGLLAYIFKTMEVKTSFKIFGVFYLTAIIVMCSLAVSIALKTHDIADVLYACGAVLFTASDIVLIFNTFSGTTRFSLRVTNLALYYAGQLLIAFSLFKR